MSADNLYSDVNQSLSSKLLTSGARDFFARAFICVPFCVYNVQAMKAQASLHRYAGSSEPSLLAYAIIGLWIVGQVAIRSEVHE